MEAGQFKKFTLRKRRQCRKTWRLFRIRIINCILSSLTSNWSNNTWGKLPQYRDPTLPEGASKEAKRKHLMCLMWQVDDHRRTVKRIIPIVITLVWTTMKIDRQVRSLSKSLLSKMRIIVNCKCWLQEMKPLLKSRSMMRNCLTV